MSGPWEKYAGAASEAAPAPAGPWEKYQEPEPQKADGLSWSEVPLKAVKNLPSSAVNFAHDMVQPILHPIDTGKAIGHALYGVGSKAVSALGVEQDPAAKAEREATADAIGKHFADRYGGMEGFKKALAEDPVGVAGDLSIVLTGGGAAAARAPGVVGKVGKVAQRAGEIIDPVRQTMNAGQAVAKVGGHTIAAGQGLASGAGRWAMEEAFDAGRKGNQAFVDHMRGNAPLRDVVDMADDANAALKKDRSAAYQADIASTKASQQVLDIAPVYQALKDGHDFVSYQGIVKSPDAAKKLNQMAEIIEQFRQLPPAVGRTPEAFDQMKQALGAIWKTAGDDPVSRAVTGNIYHSVKDQIVKQVPEYATAMKGFEEASDVLSEVRSNFSLTDKASNDTKLRKLQSVARNNANTNYGARLESAETMATKQPNLLPAIAGQSVNSWTPRGIQGTAAPFTAIATIPSNPHLAPAFALSSPRLMGEANQAAGRALGMVEDMASRLGITKEAAITVLRRAYGTGQLTDPELKRELQELSRSMRKQ